MLSRDDTQIEDARARYARSQEIRNNVSAALDAETARRRALVEKFIALGRAVPPAPEVDASAGRDASVIDDSALNITDASSVDDVKKALAASQALARVKLHEAKVARAHCDVMEAALAAS